MQVQTQAKSERSRQQAINRLGYNRRLQQIMTVIPEMRSIINQAVTTRYDERYNFRRVFDELRGRAARHVGWQAQNRMFQSQADYDLVVNTLREILP